MATDTHLFSSGPSAEIDASPSYLSDYKDLYRRDARQAGLQWFRDARYGLSLHYGLYSVLGRHDWAQFCERIPVADYAQLKGQFGADGFDAMRIVEFAIASGMRYVGFTARHHDGFCLWNSRQTDFTSATAPARRDLVGELAVACETHGIGLCLRYSHGRDWRHPHAPNNDAWGGNARPAYEPPEPSYAYGPDHHLETYVQFVEDQIHELLTAYGPIAAISLDGIAVPLSGDRDRFRCQDLYDMIHSLQPQVLVAYEQGLLGTEDFRSEAAPELPPADRPAPPLEPKRKGPQPPPRELRAAMSRGGLGYGAAEKGTHLTSDQVWNCLLHARSQEANLLLNTGLLPDGQLDPEDFRALLEVGERLDLYGWPGGPHPAAKGAGKKPSRRRPGA